MAKIIKGKKCCIYENVTEYDYLHSLSLGRSKEIKERNKKYEVYKLIPGKFSSTDETEFPLDTPHYEPLGWDNLEDAKAFFLLQEI